MAQETIVLDIKINAAEIKAAADAVTALNDSKQKLIATNQQLAQDEAKNADAIKKNSDQIKAINTALESNSRVLQANKQAIKANADSIDDLKQKNKELLKERNATTTATEEGRQKIAKLNAEYDKNSKTIAENSTQVEKQRFNIGNYKSALDGISPALGNFSQGLETSANASGGLVSGIWNMVKASLAFIATPIGAIIAALALAFKALQTYLTGSEEGMDKFERISAQVSAVMDVLKHAVIGVGGAIADFLSGDFSGGIDRLSESFTGLGDKMKYAADQAGELADIFDTLDEMRLKNQIQNDEESNQIKNLIIQSKNRNLTDVERNDLLTKAIELEKKLTGSKIAIAVADLNASTKQFLIDSDRMDLEQRMGESTIDFAKRIATEESLLIDGRQKLVDKLGEYNGLLDAQSNIQEKIQNQQDAIAEKAAAEAEKAKERREKEAADAIKKAEQEAKKKEDEAKKASDAEEKARQDRIKQLEDENAHADQVQKDAYDEALKNFTDQTQAMINEKKRELLEGVISQEEYNKEISDLQLAALETQQLINEEFAEKDLKLEQQTLDYKQQLKDKEVAMNKAKEDAKVAAVQNGIGIIASAFNKQSVAFKVLASAQTLITTYQSAIAAFNSLANIPYVGTILGIAAAAAATANGLAAVARINGTSLPKMEEGGVIDIQGKRHSQGGEIVTVGGKPVAEVEQGEHMVVLKRGSTGMLRSLSNINKLSGGVDFFSDRSPKRHLADGGFVARSAASQVSSFQTQSLAEDIKKLKLYVAVTDINNAQKTKVKVDQTSELR